MKINKIGKTFILINILILATSLFNLTLYAQKNYCIECHQELEDELLAPVEAFKTDIHQQFGLSCANCHGGNPSEEDIDLAKDKTFKGIPQRTSIPLLCASCHSDPSYMRRFNPSIRVDQLELYWTSKHGHLLKKGETRVAVCTDCPRGPRPWNTDPDRAITADFAHWSA